MPEWFVAPAEVSMGAWVGVVAVANASTIAVVSLWMQNRRLKKAIDRLIDRMIQDIKHDD